MRQQGAGEAGVPVSGTVSVGPGAVHVGPQCSDEVEVEGGEVPLVTGGGGSHKRTNSSGHCRFISCLYQHCSLPLTFLKATVIPPPDAHISTVFPARKHSGTSHCSPVKAQPPQPNGQPVAVWPSSLHPVLYSCQTSPRPPTAHVHSQPPGTLLHHLQGARALPWGIPLLVTARTYLCR